MGNLSYSSIFKNVNKYEVEYDGTISYTGILLGAKLNQKNGQDYKLIDAIDIDWNGAYVSSLGATINTTEDLIIVLNSLNPKNLFNGLSEDVQNLIEAVTYISNTYVTQSYLGETLLSYQNKLIAGDHITIDDSTNIITTYDTISNENLYNALLSYTDNDTFNEFRRIVNNNYYTKIETVQVAEEIAQLEVKKVIDNADEAFDTLKEIADWIIAQRRYEEISYEDMIKDGSVTYYIFNEEQNKYEAVDLEFILNNPTTQYYTLNDTATDVSKLFKTVNELQTTVGSETINKDGTVSYTGILLNIHDIYDDIDILSTQSATAINTALDAVKTARESNNLALESKSIAYTSYDLAYSSLITAYTAIDKSLDSYNMAYSAYIAVGNPSTIGKYVEITDKDKEDIVNGESDIYTYIINSNGFYIPAKYDGQSTEIFYKYEPSISATGLYSRIEDVEKTVDDLSDTVETNTKNIAKSLYNLYVDNSASSYVQLGLSPEVFNGTPDRFLTITTTNAEIDKVSGEIKQDGIPTIITIKDCFSYLTSWQILTNSQNTLNE